MSPVDESAASESGAPPARAPQSQRPAGPTSLIGLMLSGRYKIERLLGEGAMGAVYAAEHVLIRKRVAIKVLHPNMTRVPEVVARFEREAISASRIGHPNVAAATDFGKLDDGSFFLVLEFVEGASLRVTIDRGRCDVPRTLHIVRQLANALVRAHSLGIVHRDLKPENVMLVARDDDPEFVKVLDFGIAKVPVGEVTAGGNDHGGNAAGPALTQLGTVYGTPEYMAPEQALGLEIDARADLYAVGIMMYELLTGRRPFLADSPIALLGMHVNAVPPPMSEAAPDAVIPPEIALVVERLLEKEPDRRVQSAKELLALLAPLAPQPISLLALPSADASSMHASGSRQLHVPRVVAVVLNRVHGLPRQAVYAAFALAGLLVLLLIVTVVAATRTARPDQSSDAARQAASASQSAAGMPLMDAPTHAALDLVGHGDFTRGIDALVALPDADKKLPEVRRALVTAYASTERWAECMRALDAWFLQDPAIASDPKVAAMVHDAAVSPDSIASALAFVHLERHFGADGLDELYELGYGARKVPPAVRDRARKAILAPELRARMSPALAVTADVSAAGYSCKVKELFPRAQSDGDQRTIAALKPLQARQPVGLFGMNDGLACVHDGSLSKTITAIEARVR